MVNLNGCEHIGTYEDEEVGYFEVYRTDSKRHLVSGNPTNTMIIPITDIVVDKYLSEHDNLELLIEKTVAVLRNMEEN